MYVAYHISVVVVFSRQDLEVEELDQSSKLTYCVSVIEPHLPGFDVGHDQDEGFVEV